MEIFKKDKNYLSRKILQGRAQLFEKIATDIFLQSEHNALK